MHKLSLEEENMTKFSLTGHSAWGTMYSDFSSALSASVHLPSGVREMFIASTEAMCDDRDAKVRRASWEAIRSAWLPHRETCAAALNAITGWRLDMYNKRNYDSFLTSSLHMKRMTNATFKALLSTVDDSTGKGRRALRIQVRALGKDNMHACDLYAPSLVGDNVGGTYTLDEGIELIASAVSEVDPAVGEFVYMMRIRNTSRLLVGIPNARGRTAQGLRNRERRLCTSVTIMEGLLCF